MLFHVKLKEVGCAKPESLEWKDFHEMGIKKSCHER